MTSSANGFLLRRSEYNTIYVSRSDGENQGNYSNIFGGTTLVSADNLYHIVLTRNNNVFTIYINGEFDDSDAIVTTPNGIWYNEADIILGKGNPTSSNEMLDGNLDEIGIWNIALPPESINTLYVNGTSSNANVSASNLIAHYNFNSGSGDTLYDHSGNQNHGTINGARWIANGTKHVAEGGSNETGSGSVDNPFSSIQYAIDMASNGDTVLVSAGTYYENIRLIDKSVSIIGVDGEEIIIDAGGESIDKPALKIGSFSGGFYNDSQGSQYIEDVLIIKNITFTNSGYEAGLSIGHSNVIIEDCISENNIGGDYGGGLFVTHSNSVIVNNSIFRNNQGQHGVGITYMYNSNGSINNCLIDNNSCSRSGGVHTYENCNVNINNCIISNNTCSDGGSQGGGVNAKGGNINIYHSVISKNSANQDGAAIFLENGANTILSNCNIYDNDGAQSSIHIGSGNNLSIINSIWSDNSSTIRNYGNTEVSYSLIEYGQGSIVNQNNGEMTWAEGNIDADPLFCDAENGEFTVRSDSPVLGAGQDGANMGALGIGCELTTIELVEGWNWISFNLESDDYSLNNMLASLDGSASYIKDQFSFAQYTNGEWWGPLVTLSPSDGYMITANEDVALEYSGVPLDASSTPIELVTGWNWIGYIPQIPLYINTALSSIDGSASYIKDQFSFSQYHSDSNSWPGSLDTLSPSVGYKLIANEDVTLIYNEGDGDLASIASPYIQHFEAVNRTSSKLPNWTVNPSQYAYTGTFTSIVKVEGIEIDDTYDILGAFVGNECRGIAKLSNDFKHPHSVFDYKDQIGHVFFTPVVYSNTTSGEMMTFTLWDASEDTYIELGSHAFTPDMIEGTFTNPFVFGSSNLLGTNPLQTEYSLDKAYPNPFNPVTTIRFALPIEDQVSIIVYNLQGREIISLIDGNMGAGYHSVIWNADHHSSGMYFVKMVTGDYINTQKLMLVK